MAERVQTIRTKLIVGNKVKGDFKNVIEPPQPIREKKPKDVLVTKVIKGVEEVNTTEQNDVISDVSTTPLMTKIVRSVIPTVDQMAKDAKAKATASMNETASNKAAKGISQVDEKKFKEATAPKPVKVIPEETKATKVVIEEKEEKQMPEKNCSEVRPSTDEELEIFDSIDRRDESGWTENERAFMELYANDNCPTLEEMQIALDKVTTERANADDENDAPYEEQSDYEESSKHQKKKTTSSKKTKKEVADEY